VKHPIFKGKASERKAFKGKLGGAIVLSFLISLLTMSILATGAISTENPHNIGISQSKIQNPKSKIASVTRSPEEFSPIEQPLSLKVGITLGGLSLIGLELWWFLGSKPLHNQ